MPTRLTLAALALVVSTAAQAQDRVRIDPQSRKTVVTLNPFAVLAAYVTGDVEVKTAPAVSVGVGFSVGDETFDRYRSFEAKARYYPAEKALQGFSVAGTLGVASGTEYRYEVSTQAGSVGRTTRPTLGTELSYQWIVGPSAKFVVVTGVGVKRYFGDNGNTDFIDTSVLPTARINIGFAF